MCNVVRNFYDKKIDQLQKKIGKELIASAAKQDAYYQKISKLAFNMKQFHNWIRSSVVYTYCNKIYQNNKQLSVLDMAVGRGGDILKYYYAEVAFMVGLDIAKDGLYSPVDGALSRYDQQRKRKANFPKMYFIQSDCGIKLNYDDQYKALGGMNQENKKLFEQSSNFEKQKKVIGNILSKIKADGVCGFEIKKDDKLDRVGTITIVYSDTQYFRNPGESYEFLVSFRKRIHKLLDSLGFGEVYVAMDSVLECE